MKAEELNKEFWERVKDKFPYLDEKRVKLASTHHFKFLKENIEKEEFNDFHFKYFGKFVIYPKKVIGSLNKLILNKNLNKISTEEFLERKRIYEKIIKKHETNI